MARAGRRHQEPRQRHGQHHTAEDGEDTRRQTRTEVQVTHQTWGAKVVMAAG